jgi:RNA polymerase sigma-B factor
MSAIVSRARERLAEHAAFRRYARDRDPALRDALVERYMPLARHLARRYPSGDEDEDVLQVAALALVKAIERYDPERGTAFTSFATPTIVGEIKRYFRDCGWVVRTPRRLQELALRLEREGERLTARLGRRPTAAELAERLEAPLEHVLEALASATAHHPVTLDAPSARDAELPAPPVVASVEDGFRRVEDAQEIESLLVQLPDGERTMIVLRYREDMLQREIADLLETSQMQVSRVLSSALARLQELAGPA